MLQDEDIVFERVCPLAVRYEVILSNEYKENPASPSIFEAEIVGTKKSIAWSALGDGF